jgi:hypothetical protein
MRWKCLETFSGPDIPNPDTLIKRSGHDQVGLRVEVTAEDVVAVTFQRLEALAGTELPDFEGLVVGCAHQKPRVAGPGDVADAQLVAGNGLLEFAIMRAPNLDLRKTILINI